MRRELKETILDFLIGDKNAMNLMRRELKEREPLRLDGRPPYESHEERIEST